MKFFRILPSLYFICLLSACSSGPPKEKLQSAVENAFLNSSSDEFQVSKITKVSSKNFSEEVLGYKLITVRLVLNASFAAKVDCLAEKRDAEIKYPPYCLTEAAFKKAEADIKNPSTDSYRMIASEGIVNNYNRAKTQGGRNFKVGDEFEIKNISVTCETSPNERPEVWHCSSKP